MHAQTLLFGKADDPLLSVLKRSYTLRALASWTELTATR